ncbi:MAG TPA: choice-of-anchor tandem repeat GloVer-containing protein [Aliidongia sp.]|uniref:choice-of-anchor tandem repeat GloVer-containing protein n=1 Tax=Aliidongia sp. TaxID=1914230 RepID=UPI002DDD13FE|nr:choice-of-anchor tandem repeat GloVer-containing protein [Aliidongia sp.]HEV2677900.1 choice-of-anchor tandem repeat GloVer-containing protein [Aliidongia sp.]
MTRSKFRFGSMLLSLAVLASPASAGTLSTQAYFDGTDGAVPNNGGLLYSDHFFYGATYAGSAPPNLVAGPADLGVIFQQADTILEVPDTPPSVVYAFSGPDGAHPNGSLVADAQGNLYGTTRAGGSAGLGTVFKLTNPRRGSGLWPLTTLHAFAGPDGSAPVAGVTLGPDGSIYGTTLQGGTAPLQAGTVFKIAPDGSYRVLHSFTGVFETGDGSGPASNIVLDPQGTVIGTTSVPVAVNQKGTLYAILPNGNFVVVTQFTEIPSGGPAGAIVRDLSGNVFGALTSAEAGPRVFEVTAITHKQVVIGELPGDVGYGGVMRDNAGNFYLTTSGEDRRSGGGVYQMTPHGVVTQLATLGYMNQGPLGGVTLDPAGNLWGTSSAGGETCTTSANVTVTGCGTVFVVTP